MNRKCVRFWLIPLCCTLTTYVGPHAYQLQHHRCPYRLLGTACCVHRYHLQRSFSLYDLQLAVVALQAAQRCRRHYLWYLTPTLARGVDDAVAYHLEVRVFKNDIQETLIYDCIGCWLNSRASQRKPDWSSASWTDTLSFRLL
jgi:hypothetical protein